MGVKMEECRACHQTDWFVCGTAWCEWRVLIDSTRSSCVRIENAVLCNSMAI
jgi:hypothetical protein